jgi:prepilin-type N-terminal cleavage/methylation domain-containing protein
MLFACKLQTPTARRGWTLVEMLVVLAVILILAALGFFLFTASQGAAERLEREAHAAAEHASRHLRPQRDRPGRKAGAAHAKLSPGAPTGFVPNHYVVTFKPGVNPVEAAHQLGRDAAVQVRHVYKQVYKGAAVRADAGAAARLKQLPFVASLDQERYVSICAQTLSTGVERLSFAHTKIRPPFLLPIPGDTSGAGIRNIRTVPGAAGQFAVAVIDTGIDNTHPDLNVVNSVGFGFANGMDQNGHGTHVAGIIGAVDNTIGVVGVFAGVPLWSLRVLDAQGNGISSDLIAALEFAALNIGFIQVVNMSLGGPYFQPVNDATAALVQLGMVVVVAAGNATADASTFSPASTPNAITVAALADSDGLPGGLGAATPFGSDDTFATFSNFGSSVAVIAPGVDILSTYLGGGYQMLSGTSQATPHVSGLCALIIADRNNFPYLGTPRNLEPNGGLALSPGGIVGSPPRVRSMLVSNCVEQIKGIFDARAYHLVAGLP